MKIAIVSDSHDHLQQIEKALVLIKEHGCQRILHCGDFVSPFAMRAFCKAQIPVDAVFGNNDGDRFALGNLQSVFSHLTIHGETGFLDLDGFGIAFTHYPPIAEGLFATRRFDLVCFGHSHTWFEERNGDLRLLNPGEIMGKDGRPSFAIVDTETRECRPILLPGT